MAYDEFKVRTCKCPECGREFVIPGFADWKYKTTTFTGKVENLCSYTCYDHSMIRKEGLKKYITKEKYAEVVKRNENVMIGQGKKILSPIKVV